MLNIINDNFMRNKQKQKPLVGYLTRNQCLQIKPMRKKTLKRFSTAASQQVKIDYRLKTFYPLSQQYTFSGKCYHTKYNKTDSFCRSQNDKKMTDNFMQSRQNEEKPQQNYIKVDQQIVNKQQIVFKDSTQHVKKYSLNQTFYKLNSQNKQLGKRKFKIRHPSPVKQSSLLLGLKKQFLQLHQPTKKASFNLIELEQFLSQKKQSFKRSIQIELIRVGEAKLIPMLKQKRGKVYLDGLHMVKSKEIKRQKNVDQILIRSRKSYSTRNGLIAHIKVADQKKIKKFHLGKDDKDLLDKLDLRKQLTIIQPL